MNFKIPVFWMVGGDVEIEADSLEEAIKQAEDAIPVQVKYPTYVDGSWSVDKDAAREKYEVSEPIYGSRDGQIFANCPECGERVWFDCLDRDGVEEFVESGEVCIVCKAKGEGDGP